MFGSPNLVGYHQEWPKIVDSISKIVKKLPIFDTSRRTLCRPNAAITRQKLPLSLRVTEALLMCFFLPALHLSLAVSSRSKPGIFTV